MADLNKVFLMGNLTFDPELRRTPSGTAVSELRMVTSRSWTSRDGERREEKLFIDVTVWDRQAENCCQYLRKGSPIHVEGSLKMDTWDDKSTGEKRSKIRVHGRSRSVPRPRRGDSQGDSGGTDDDVSSSSSRSEPAAGVECFGSSARAARESRGKLPESSGYPSQRGGGERLRSVGTMTKPKTSRFEACTGAVGWQARAGVVPGGLAHRCTAWSGGDGRVKKYGSRRKRKRIKRSGHSRRGRAEARPAAKTDRMRFDHQDWDSHGQDDRNQDQDKSSRRQDPRPGRPAPIGRGFSSQGRTGRTAAPAGR